MSTQPTPFPTHPRHALGLGVRDQSINLDCWLEDADGNPIIQSGPPVDPNYDQTIKWLKTTVDAGTYNTPVETQKGGRAPLAQTVGRLVSARTAAQ